jgi:hypothetical protein
LTVSEHLHWQACGDAVRPCSGLAGAKARQGLTEAKLRELQPGVWTYKVSDGGNGLYVVVSPSGSRSFRYD